MTIERRLVALLLVLLLPGGVSAHHGSAISYDTTHLWTTWATVTPFAYTNPPPHMTFDRTTKDGQVEHWTSELLTAPAPLARAGWTRSRSEEALMPGTRVKLFIGTARAGGTAGIVIRLESEKGEEILAARGTPTSNAVDLDGVPMGLQPTGSRQTLPGRESAND